MFANETVTLPGDRKVRVYRAGQGAYALVWLHGPNGIRKNDPVTELAERYAVIAPLAPGFHDVDELDEGPRRARPRASLR